MLKSRIISVLLIAALLSSATAFSQLGVGISISANIAPPPLPVYVQPPCPGDGYLWTPGYWAYDDVDGYYWVPGVWVLPPEIGFYWTPCWWGYVGGVYGFHRGYWGPHVGFYGGVNYGYGYGGVGYEGGRWDGRTFRYNTYVTNVNRNSVHNVYVNRTSGGGGRGGRNSFNGPGGTSARPTQQETAAEREHHVQPTSQQMTHQQTSAKDRSQFANTNHGKPAVAAMNSIGGQRFNTSGRAAAAPQPVHTQAATQAHQQPQQSRQQPQQMHQQPQQARQQPQQMHQQPQAARQQPQQSRPQPQYHPQPQQARSQPQFHAQSQQARPAPQQFHPQPQARPQPQQGRQPGGEGRGRR